VKEVLEYLKKQPFYIATCENGQPRVRPFGALAEFEGKLYIVMNNKKKVYQQILANPKIEICAMGADRTWIRLEALATRDTRREARAHMLEENKGLTNLYSVDDNLMEVFYLHDATAQICAFAGEPKVVKF
jgi:uncharacterized pyridoxamine 5'-phosphate oxidase family protein